MSSIRSQVNNLGHGDMIYNYFNPYYVPPKPPASLLKGHQNKSRDLANLTTTSRKQASGDTQTSGENSPNCDNTLIQGGSTTDDDNQGDEEAVVTSTSINTVPYPDDDDEDPLPTLPESAFLSAGHLNELDSQNYQYTQNNFYHLNNLHGSQSLHPDTTDIVNPTLETHTDILYSQPNNPAPLPPASMCSTDPYEPNAFHHTYSQPYPVEEDPSSANFHDTENTGFDRNGSIGQDIPRPVSIASSSSSENFFALRFGVQEQYKAPSSPPAQPLEKEVHSPQQQSSSYSPLPAHSNDAKYHYNHNDTYNNQSNGGDSTDWEDDIYGDISAQNAGRNYYSSLGVYDAARDYSHPNMPQFAPPPIPAKHPEVDEDDSNSVLTRNHEPQQPVVTSPAVEPVSVGCASAESAQYSASPYSSSVSQTVPVPASSVSSPVPASSASSPVQQADSIKNQPATEIPSRIAHNSAQSTSQKTHARKSVQSIPIKRPIPRKKVVPASEPVGPQQPTPVSQPEVQQAGPSSRSPTTQQPAAIAAAAAAAAVAASRQHAPQQSAPIRRPEVGQVSSPTTSSLTTLREHQHSTPVRQSLVQQASPARHPETQSASAPIPVPVAAPAPAPVREAVAAPQPVLPAATSTRQAQPQQAASTAADYEIFSFDESFDHPAPVMPAHNPAPSNVAGPAEAFEPILEAPPEYTMVDELSAPLDAPPNYHDPVAVALPNIGVTISSSSAATSISSSSSAAISISSSISSATSSPTASTSSANTKRKYWPFKSLKRGSDASTNSYIAPLGINNQNVGGSNNDSPLLRQTLRNNSIVSVSSNDSSSGQNSITRRASSMRSVSSNDTIGSKKSPTPSLPIMPQVTSVKSPDLKIKLLNPQRAYDIGDKIRGVLKFSRNEVVPERGVAVCLVLTEHATKGSVLSRGSKKPASRVVFLKSCRQSVDFGDEYSGQLEQMNQDDDSILGAPFKLNFELEIPETYPQHHQLPLELQRRLPPSFVTVEQEDISLDAGVTLSGLHGLESDNGEAISTTLSNDKSKVKANKSAAALAAVPARAFPSIKIEYNILALVSTKNALPVDSKLLQVLILAQQQRLQSPNLLPDEELVTQTSIPITFLPSYTPFNLKSIVPETDPKGKKTGNAPPEVKPTLEKAMYKAQVSVGESSLLRNLNKMGIAEMHIMGLQYYSIHEPKAAEEEQERTENGEQNGAAVNNTSTVANNHGITEHGTSNVNQAPTETSNRIPSPSLVPNTNEGKHIRLNFVFFPEPSSRSINIPIIASVAMILRCRQVVSLSGTPFTSYPTPAYIAAAPSSSNIYERKQEVTVYEKTLWHSKWTKMPAPAHMPQNIKLYWTCIDVPFIGLQDLQKSAKYQSNRYNLQVVPSYLAAYSCRDYEVDIVIKFDPLKTLKMTVPLTILSNLTPTSTYPFATE